MHLQRTTLFGLSLALFVSLALATPTQAGDWSRFRGPNGSGVSPDTEPVPTKWSDTENLKWKIELPGPGLSSPIIVGKRLFITCWSGYGLNTREPGDQKDLRRHLLCIDRETGKTIWSKSVDPELPEDAYRGNFAQHGYASHTPVSDGEGVYVYFGKTGALAFDMDGKRLWQTNLGKESDPSDWGSASSPILYKNLMIVTASAESEALVALDKKTGKEVWRQEASGLSGTWGSPVLVDVGDGRQELVLGVPGEIWGFDPATGKLRWYCESTDSNQMCASVFAEAGIVYALGGRYGGSIAVRAGGKDDVTKTHVLWKGRARARIGTPVLHDGRIHWVSSKMANCIDAKTGKQIFRERLSGGGSTGGGDRPRQGGFGGRRGGGQDYSSPVAADGKLYYSTRGGDIYVLALGAEFKQLAVNRFSGDTGEYSATPAIANGQLFIRTSKYLYCVAEKK